MFVKLSAAIFFRKQLNLNIIRALAVRLTPPPPPPPPSTNLIWKTFNVKYGHFIAYNANHHRLSFIVKREIIKLSEKFPENNRKVSIL